MCDPVLSLARKYLLPLLLEARVMIRGVPREVADLKAELESIEDFINEAEKGNTSDEIKKKVKQLREAAFLIEDVIEEYETYEGQDAHDPGCAAAVELVKTVILPLQIAFKIRNIESRIGGMKDTNGSYGSQIQPSSGQGSSSSTANRNAALLQNLQEAPLFIAEADVVGFEAQSDELVGWLVDASKKRTVISVVGMGGLGKTTLAKKVYDCNKVTMHFDCRVWITVSQSYTYTGEGLLRDMLCKIHKEIGTSPPQDIFRMDRRSLIEAVRNNLQKRRYVIVFDDVWSTDFWSDIEHAVIDDKNGSKILLTTRNLDVVKSCKKSSSVKVHNLKSLPKEQSLKLFNKKAFFELGYCPEHLLSISSAIVDKCKGLPLAIVVIGGLLSGIDPSDQPQWQRFSENLSSELNKVSSLSETIRHILGFSYNDLPPRLKSCFLYFGIYPKDYVVELERLFQQWIAEGFVKEEGDKTPEEVAEGYLTQLIHRNLVQVSSISVGGKAKRCRVHDLLRILILEKFEDSSFCHNISEDGQSSLSGIIRRLSIATTSTDLMASIESPHVRSLLVFTDEADFISEYFVRRITTTYQRLRVLDVQGNLPNFPKNLGNLIYLKYLRFRCAQMRELPKSIGMLQNLETLDISGTGYCKMPKEISKLRKLRHLLCQNMSLTQLKDDIGSMTALQTLLFVGLDGDGDGVVRLIIELGKLKQLKELGLRDVRGEHGSTIFFSVNEMQQLQKLDIQSSSTYDEVIDLHLIPSPPKLRKLRLKGKLEKLSEWIPGLQNLVKLTMISSRLIDDPMETLKNMQNLLSLTIIDAYEGETLHIQEGGFQKLRRLSLEKLNNLNSIIIDKGALYSLTMLKLSRNSRLKKVPTGIRHLRHLEVLDIYYMPDAFVEDIRSDGGKEHPIIGHVTHVNIRTGLQEINLLAMTTVTLLVLLLALGARI